MIKGERVSVAQKRRNISTRGGTCERVGRHKCDIMQERKGSDRVGGDARGGPPSQGDLWHCPTTGLKNIFIDFLLEFEKQLEKGRKVSKKSKI